MNNSSNTLGFETRVCPVCGAKIAKTPDNPEGICTTFSCPESSELYGGILSATDSEKEYNRKIQDSVEFCNLSNKYLGLYLGSPHKALGKTISCTNSLTS